MISESISVSFKILRIHKGKRLIYEKLFLKTNIKYEIIIYNQNAHFMSKVFKAFTKIKELTNN